MTPQRIDSACFEQDTVSGEFLIEFWALPGSIFRTQYNKRTTVTKREFIEVWRWEYAQLRRMADATDYAI